MITACDCEYKLSKRLIFCCCKFVLYLRSLRSCCSQVDRTTDFHISHTGGPRFESQPGSSALIDKAIYPHCLVSRKGRKTVGPMVACLLCSLLS